MDYWTLRRQIRELAVDYPAPLFLQRFVGLPTGGIGMIAALNRQEFCWEIAIDPPKQWLRVTPDWEESEREPAFAKALNRLLKSARIVGWELIGDDRVVGIHLRRRESYFEGNIAFTLICEFTGRISNCLLCDADRLVLEQWRTTGNNRLRSPYCFPGLTTTGSAGDRTAADPPDLATIPFSEWGRVVSGFSPIVSREVAFLAEEQRISRKEAWKHLQPQLAASIGPVRVYRSGAKIAAVSAVPLHHLETTTAAESFERVNDALNHIFLTDFSRRLLDGLRTQALNRCARELMVVEEHIAGQMELLQAGALAERWKKAGDLILQNPAAIPLYVTSASVRDPETGEMHVLELDPGKSAVDNASRFFHRYKKAKRSIGEVTRRLETLRRREEWLREQQWFCTSATRADELQALLEVLAGKPVPKASPERKTKPKPTLDTGSCRYFVGKNARQNQQVTFTVGKKGDLWFHALEVPGSHVIAKKDGSAFTDEEVKLGAQLAAYFSFARHSGKVAVDYTDVGAVRKIPGGGAGQVYYTQQKTVFVNPQEVIPLLNPETETPSSRPVSGRPDRLPARGSSSGSGA